MSRLDLILVPTHPDRVGGLGFLSNTVYAFTPLTVAHGALLAGLIANRIFYLGAGLLEFKIEMAVLVSLLLCVVLGPLLVFAPQLAQAKRTGNREYSTLAQRYVREFDAKWLRGGAPADESLVGSADIQSLADLGNSFEVVQTMRLTPITKEAILQLAAAALTPVAPLALTVMPPEELLKKLMGILFQVLRQYLDDPGWRNGASLLKRPQTAPTTFDIVKRYAQKRDETQDPTRPLMIDEADRLKTASLEQVRDIFDRGDLGVVLIGMPGLEKRLARYPQLYSRVGFVHAFRPLSAAHVRELLHQKWLPSGVALPNEGVTDEEARAAIIRVTGGNFRLLHRLLTQIARLAEINALYSVTREVVEAARESLVIGTS